MKKYLFLSIAFIVFINMQSDAQHGDAQHTMLKGPMAKNHKQWKSHLYGTSFLVTQHNELKGPSAKNKRVRKEDMKMNPVVFESSEELKGPRAKNFSPERNISQVACRGKKRCLKTNFALFNSF